MSPPSQRRPSIAEIAERLSRVRGATLRHLAAEFDEDERVGVHAVIEAALARDRARRREKERIRRLYALECELRASGCQLVAGVDEVGRGALAGPLTTCACILPECPRILGLDDSKALTPARREEIAEVVRANAVSVSIAHITAAEIDRIGMGPALRIAFQRAIDGLEYPVDHVIVDGLPLGVAEAETAVVGGDGKVAAIAAASIVAKVTRDALMVSIAEKYPEYGFAANKGYGTPEHLSALDRFGPSELHRRTFMPCGGTERLF